MIRNNVTNETAMSGDENYERMRQDFIKMDLQRNLERDIIGEKMRKFNEGCCAKNVPTKKPFYEQAFVFRSKDCPRVYKLNGDTTTFDEGDIIANHALKPKEYVDDFDYLRKQYLSGLTDKDMSFSHHPLNPPRCKKQEKEDDEILIDVESHKESQEDTPKPPPKWKKYIDKDGDYYYYNVLTKLTQWNKPDNFNDQEI